MLEFLKLFTNREISIIIWTILSLSVLIIISKITYKDFYNLIKLLFSKYFIPFYLIATLYLTSIIFLFKKFSFWEFYLYKDFVYWLLTTGIVLFYNAHNLETYKDFTKVVLKAISATILIEFIINNYNFSLIGELILIPILTFIALLLTTANMKKNDRNSKIVSKFLNNILSFIGSLILFYSIYNLVISYNVFFTLNKLKSFLLPPVFTLLFLPFIYFLVLYMKYERVFMNLERYEFLSKKRKRMIKFAIIKYANVRFEKIENSNTIILFNKSELQNENNINSYIKKNI